MADLKVSGRLYRDGALAPGVLHIDTGSGRITKVIKSGKADLDFGDQAILPGAIDLHVHFRDPGATHKEDFQTGSTAAAFGGVTTVVDMPNTTPPTTTMKALREKLTISADKSVVDYGVWAGATWYLDDLPKMLPHCAGIKIYLGATTGDLLLEDGDRVREAIKIAGRAGKPVVLHSESQRVLHEHRRTEERLEDHDTTRPPRAEVEAIFDIMKGMATISPAPPIHIAHIASHDAVEAATRAGFSMGVCPHHLLLDTATCCDATPGRGKMNPPIRSPQAMAALWADFAAGRMPILESDHAPHTKTEKDDKFHQVPSGVPGVETILPVMLAQAQAGRVELSTVVDALTVGPAQLLGLDDRGQLKAGMQADFSVLDLDTVTAIDESDLHSKCGWSPFHGIDGMFPSHVFQRGHAVIDDGTLQAAAGDGHPIFPSIEDD